MPKTYIRSASKRKTPKPVAEKMCGSCIFRSDGNQANIRPGRLDEIRTYLLNGKAHQCHGPQIKGKRTSIVCRGGRDYQLQVWSRMGLITEATDEALEDTMRKLGLF